MTIFILTLFAVFFSISIWAMLFNRECKHKWQTRGNNKWFLPTYRVCLKCGEAQHRTNKPFEVDEWDKCERIKHLDNQFDEKGKLI